MIKKNYFYEHAGEKSMLSNIRAQTLKQTRNTRQENEQTDFMSDVLQTQHFSKQPVEHYKLSNVSTQRSLSANLPTPTGDTTEQTGSVSVAALRTKFEQMK